MPALKISKTMRVLLLRAAREDDEGEDRYEAA